MAQLVISIPDEIPSEVSSTFLQFMVNRMATSYFKYGPVSDAYPHRVHAVASLIQRLDKYAETGNAEFLVDAANFAMIEFMYPSHINAHYRPTDSDESPGRIGIVTNKPTKSKNKDIFIDESKSR